MREANEVKTTRARRLRKEPRTRRTLCGSDSIARAHGHKFVRQEPIGPYSRFDLPRTSLIEVDGEQYADGARDAVRDKWLVDRNYRVLRFWNNDVPAIWRAPRNTAITLCGDATTRIALTMLRIVSDIDLPARQHCPE